MQTTTRPVYLDCNATTPVDSRVLEAMMPALTDSFGNPSSETHSLGRAAKDMVETARGRVAELIDASAREIVFTPARRKAATWRSKAPPRCTASEAITS